MVAVSQRPSSLGWDVYRQDLRFPFFSCLPLSMVPLSTKFQLILIEPSPAKWAQRRLGVAVMQMRDSERLREMSLGELTSTLWVTSLTSSTLCPGFLIWKRDDRAAVRVTSREGWESLSPGGAEDITDTILASCHFLSPYPPCFIYFQALKTQRTCYLSGSAHCQAPPDEDGSPWRTGLRLSSPLGTKDRRDR